MRPGDGPEVVPSVGHGIGMTLHTFDKTITRVELARTRDGMGLSFSFSPSF